MAVVPTPWMLPVAFLSHFALDSLLHFGLDNHKMKLFIRVLAVDMLLAASLLLLVILRRPTHWPLLVLGGVIAASPDLMWLSPFIKDLRHVKQTKSGLWRHFHSRIQWGERPWGWVTEIPWFIAMISLLVAANVF